VIEVNDGIRVKGMKLWLDARRKKHVSFVSHAHTDHIRSHDEIITSEKTVRFIRHRGIKGKITSLPYHQPMDLEGGRITIFPSGHILGAAQIMIDTDEGKKVVYTGDLRVVGGETAERIEIKRCDILIIEATYGDPRYVFPEKEEVVAHIVTFVEGCIGREFVPLFFAYPLGKAQEVIKILFDRGYIPLVHPRIAQIATLYEELGMDLGGYMTFLTGEKCPPGSVLIFPPSARNEAAAIPKKKTAMLTGWAMDSDAKYRFGVDEAIPLSDHADYTELVGYIMVAQPEKVYTTHGSPKFASILRKRGVEALHLKESFKGVTPSF